MPACYNKHVSSPTFISQNVSFSVYYLLVKSVGEFCHTGHMARNFDMGLSRQMTALD